MAKNNKKTSIAQKVKGFIWHYHFNYIAFILIIIGIAIGLLFTAQLRTRPTRSTDSVISYSSLAKTKDKLLADQDNYKKEITDINAQIREAQETIKLYSTSKDKVELVEKYEEKIGLTDMSGSGLFIKLDDSKDFDASADSIAHAADLRDIINLLWGSGAKAISVNNERVVMNTSIDCIVNTVLINATKTTPPFIIEVIGDKDSMYLALNNQENLRDIYQRIENEGLILEFEKRDDLNIVSFNGSLNLNYIDIK